VYLKYGQTGVRKKRVLKKLEISWKAEGNEGEFEEWF
jgi:hypothetical protein